MIKVNERVLPFPAGTRLADISAQVKPEADIFIINGHPAGPDTRVREGDECILIKRGETPSRDELSYLLHARHTPGVHARIEKAAVGIMGLGGLGSTVAVALARLGVGGMILADYDVVEPSNLNRQQYFIDQIGRKKTQALKENLSRINPYVAIEVIDTMLTEDLIPLLFKDVDVLAECFDQAKMKAAALRAVLRNMKGIGYVASSGVAGYADNNSIKTRRLFPRIYLVGDEETAAQPGRGLMAPRVGIAAHHQANQILRLLLDIE